MLQKKSITYLFFSLIFIIGFTGIHSEPANFNHEQFIVMSYWPNWSVYSNANNGISGSYVYGSHDKKKILYNSLSQKLKGVNILAYAFFQTQAKTYRYYDASTQSFCRLKNPWYQQDGGDLYFSDPFVDLASNSQLCHDNRNLLCSYALKVRHLKTDINLGLGNFNAFVHLQRPDSKKLGPIYKIISIGGEGHDDSFTDSFNSTRHINNFVNSTVNFIKYFYHKGRGIVGIDLDYESLTMTHRQGLQYARLVKALRKKLTQTFGKNNTLLVVTLLSSPSYLAGTADHHRIGFDKKALIQLAKYSDYLNLMTYNFNGSFNYQKQGTGKTGFMTNIFLQKYQPANQPYSIYASIKLLSKFVAPSHILVGMPAYGYAIANIDNHNHGLFQPMTPDSLIPRGDLDNPFCQHRIDASQNRCGGFFSYRWIVRHRENQSFIQKNWLSKSIINGTTAFAKQIKCQGKTYKNFFISYCSSQLAGSITEYALKNNLGGVMLWQINDDIDFNQKKNDISLLGAISNHL